MTTSINIDGPSGPLEALWSQTSKACDNSTEPNADVPARCALLCHPHPQFGGSMHDGVLAIAASVLSAQGFAHLRFNFRGVGSSAGQFDNGQGEGDDICAAWHWLTAQAPTADNATNTEPKWSEMLLVGYSFGSAVSWSVRERCPNLNRLLLIAPPTQAMPFAGSAGEQRTHVIVGDKDSYCDLTALPAGASAKVIAGGDHFFSGAAGELGDAIADAL